MSQNSIYFDFKDIQPKEGYVCWIDMMGATSIMMLSLKRSTNFIGRIHDAAITCNNFDETIDLYPILDGLYAFCEDRETTVKYLKCIFKRLFKHFVKQNNNHRFMIRASIAYGKVVLGKEIQKENNKTLGDNPSYKDNIIIGMPIVQAYYSENKAPPFGIFIHESARANGAFAYSWLQWWRDPDINKKDLQNIKKYLEWCLQRPNMIGYPEDAISRHLDLFLEYIEQKNK